MLHTTLVVASILAQPSTGTPPTPGQTQPAAADKSAEIFATGEVKTIATNLKFTEGPIWHEGKLLFCDVQADTIYTLDPEDGKETRTPDDGLVKVISPSGRAVGSAHDPKKGGLVHCRFDGTIARLDKEGKMTVLASELDGKGLNGPNDLCARADGTIYFTDFRKGDGEKKLGHFGVYRIDPAGKLSLETKDVTSPNGIAISNDGKTLYVAQMSKGEITAYDIAADGSISGARVFADLASDAVNTPKIEGRSSPDGLHVDAAGNVWTTAAGGIWVLNKEGKRIATLRAPNASNFCFGGADGETLFITAGTKLYSTGLKNKATPPVMSGPDPKPVK